MALVRGDEEGDDAYVGAILIAEVLRSIRDWDANTFRRQW